MNESVKGYCFRCDEVRPIADAVETRTANLHRLLLGACDRCGGVICRFVGDGDETGRKFTVKVGPALKRKLQFVSAATQRPQRVIVEDILERFLGPWVESVTLTMVESNELTPAEAVSAKNKLARALEQAEPKRKSRAHPPRRNPGILERMRVALKALREDEGETDDEDKDDEDDEIRED